MSAGYTSALQAYFYPNGKQLSISGEHWWMVEAAFKAGWDAREAIIGPAPAPASDTDTSQRRTFLITEVGPNEIYAAYPLKVGKQAALKAIKKAHKDTNIHYGSLLIATQAYAAAVATWPEQDKKYIPHCATWMNRGSYDDEPSTWMKGKPVYQSQFGVSH